MKNNLLLLSALFVFSGALCLAGCADDGSPIDGGDLEDGDGVSGDGALDAGGDMAGDQLPDGEDGGDQVADIDWDSLHGTVPDEALAAPVFTVQNRDGTDRTQADLIGNPTVMWFYPKAATSG